MPPAEAPGLRAAKTVNVASVWTDYVERMRWKPCVCPWASRQWAFCISMSLPHPHPQGTATRLTDVQGQEALGRGFDGVNVAGAM